MLQWVQEHGGTAGVVVLVATALNVVLSATKVVVETMVPSPEKQAANPIWKAASTGLGWLKTILDWASANRPH